MIDQIDELLRRVLTGSGAQAAVIWANRPGPATATALTSCPAGLILPGTQWTADPDALGDIQRTPDQLSIAVPNSLRSRLTQVATAAQTFPLDGGNLFLLVIWGDRRTERGIDSPSRRLVDNELSYLAPLLEDNRFNHRESERLLAVIDALDEGVVSVSSNLGQANVNAAAAKFLGVQPGQVSIPEFTTAMTMLCGRADNRQQVAMWTSALESDGDAASEVVLHFNDKPTHLRVRTIPMLRGDFAGRIWVISDESNLLEALDLSEQSRARMRAASDSLLDPQVLLEPKREASGRIVDFVYREINRATSDYLGLPADDLLGRGAVETMPGLADVLLPGYIRCLETGEPFILNDFSYDNELLQDVRRYDLRVTRVGSDSLVLTWRDVTDRFQVAQNLAEARDLLRSATDAMLDPHTLVEARIDSAGDVVDLIFRDVNGAFCDYIGLTREDLLGHSMLAIFPNVIGSGLMQHYARCAVTGEPVILDDFEYVTEFVNETRRFDIRGSQVHSGLITLTIRDTTARFEDSRRLADSEEKYRLLSQNISDAITHVRDGRFVWVSPAIENILGAPPEYWIGREVREVIPPEDTAAFVERLAILAAGGTIQQRIRLRSVDGATHWVHAHSTPFFDAEGRQDGYTGAMRLVDDEVAAEEEMAEVRRQRARTDALYRRSMGNAAVGMCLADLEGHFVEVNAALCSFFGYDTEEMLQKTWQELTAPDYLQADLDNRAQVLAGDVDSYRMVKVFIHAAGHAIWGDLSVSCIRSADGDVEIFIGQITDVTNEVRVREQLEEARRQQARAHQLFRRSIDSAAIGMCLIDPDGRFIEVNDAICRFFGYDAEALKTRTWQQLTAPAFLAADLSKVADVLDGRLDSYRMLKQYVHADGRPIWGDLSVSCIRDHAGRVERFISQINDVTATVEANEQNAELHRRLAEELQSAAGYMASIMPAGLTGAVTISSRYLPSRELGGDCFDYAWIDGDHLMVYLIDVSGHGIEPALLAVSLQNILRAGTFPIETLLDPTAVMTELNRLFQMEDQSEHFFTMWFGVFERTTRILRYASAGTPPAYVFTPAADGLLTIAELGSTSAPVGAFQDTAFITACHSIAPGSRILIYSDGASELRLADGRQLSQKGFETIVTRAVRLPEWSLEDLVDRLRDVTASGVFSDDLSLIQLAFD